jgi:hypothetical protein
MISSRVFVISTPSQCRHLLLTFLVSVLALCQSSNTCSVSATFSGARAPMNFVRILVASQTGEDAPHQRQAVNDTPTHRRGLVTKWLLTYISPPPPSSPIVVDVTAAAITTAFADRLFNPTPISPPRQTNKSSKLELTCLD